MVGRKVLRWSLIAVTFFGARTGAAGPISLTGNVANDFNPQTNPGVVVITDADHQNPAILESAITQPAYMTQSGLISGMDLKDIRLDYDASTDTMYVGVNTWGVAGNVDGNGTPGTVSPQFAALGGSDPADWAGAKSLVVGFAPLVGSYNSANPPTPVLVAGIPGTTTQLGPGLDGFNVAKYTAVGGGGGTISLYDSFGPTITAGLGGLAFQPSAQTPGFEFTITNFSKITGINPANGMVVSAQDGTVSPLTGKDGMIGTFPEAQTIPEPSTLLVWAGLAGGMGLASYRRSRRTRN
jgi:hypothetical protein